MNASVVRAERHATVRRWARGCRRERLMDDVALVAIESAHPDDRRRLGPVFRSLAFFFAAFAITAAFALVMLVVKPPDSGAAVLALILGAGLWAATEGLKGPLRMADTGIEAVTALAGAAFMAGGSAYMISEVLKVRDPAGARLFALSVVVLFALTALRWGSTAGALASTLWLGLLLGQFPQTRATWVAAGLILAPLALRGSESARLAPSHRRACGAVLIMALAGLYVALHIGSWDGRNLEQGSSWLFRAGRSAALPVPRAFFKVATAVVPLALLAYAIVTRRRLLLAIGLALGVVSLITLRFYVHIADLWIVLSAAGSGLIVLALCLRRWLDASAEHERAGWTARRLSGDRALIQAAEAVVTVVAATPRATAPEAPRFEGSGGRSGGGGVTSEF